MTSKITIEAHCSDDKEVVVKTYVIGKAGNKEISYVANGESLELVFYDDMVVSATEMPKEFTKKYKE